MRKTLVLILLLSSVLSWSQDNSRSKLGIKTSINLSTMTGTELSNPRIKFGYTAGVYHKIPFNDRLFLQMEYLGSTVGSKFANASDEYSKITLFSIDVPALMGYQLQDDGPHIIQAGPYVSYLAMSSVFKGDQRKAYQNGLGLNPFDVGMRLYYMNEGEYMSFQAGMKIGLTDINNGLHFEELQPPTGTNGLIRNLGFEIGMIF